MKKITKITVLTLAVIVLLSMSVMSSNGRKLPVGAYIKSAKIALISGDLERYPEGLEELRLALAAGTYLLCLYPSAHEAERHDS